MHDFVVEIGYGGSPGQFRVQVIDSPAGLAFADVVLDTGAILALRERVTGTLLLSSVPARYNPTEEEKLIRGIGKTLFGALLGAGEVHAKYRSSADFASQRDEGMRVVLRINVPELAALPWEAMYDEHGGEYVCREHQFVRQVPSGTATPRLPVTRPLRILVIIAAPSDLGPLNENAEREQLHRALGEAEREGLVQVDYAGATWTEIQEKLMDGPWHVLHFIGHGDFNAVRDEGLLALMTENSLANWVEASRFAALIRQASPMPRLAVLNSCQGAASSADDLFSSTAAVLAKNRVTAVAAMQYPVSSAAAIAFTRGFYAALARGQDVDAAVMAGRRGIIGLSGKTLEWLTPVLYLRGQQADLFTMKPAPAPDRTARADDTVTGALSGDDQPAKPAPATARGETTTPSARELAGHTSAVRYVAFSPDGALLVSEGTDNVIRAWDTATGDGRVLTDRYRSGSHRLVFAMDGRLLVEDGTLLSWDTSTGEERQLLGAYVSSGDRPFGGYYKTCAAFSPDGNIMAAANAENVVLWDLASDRYREDQRLVSRVEIMAFSRDGTMLAAALRGGVIQVVGAESLDLIKQLGSFPEEFFPNWPGESKKKRGIFERSKPGGKRARDASYGEVQGLAFDSRGLNLAAAYANGEVRVWSTRTWEPDHSMPAAPSPVRQIAIAPDADRVTVIGADNTFHLWRYDTMSPQRTLSRPVSSGSEVALSQKSRLLAAVLPDGDTQVWDTVTAQSARVLPGNGTPLRWVAFSPDGAQVATAGVDKRIRLWTL